MTAIAAPMTDGAIDSGHADTQASVVFDKFALLGLRSGQLTTQTRDSLAVVRAIMPRRPLGPREAEHLAERQGDRLRHELGILGPRLEDHHLAMLPWLTIVRRQGFPTEGASSRTEEGGLVILRADDPLVRQRFTLAHEIKHILDEHLLLQLPGDLYPASRGYSARERTERICDRFAAALLMPRILLRADWTDGMQDIAKLARRYHVSRDAMYVRLSQLGLLEQIPRCSAATAISGAQQR